MKFIGVIVGVLLVVVGLADDGIVSSWVLFGVGMAWLAAAWLDFQAGRRHDVILRAVLGDEKVEADKAARAAERPTGATM